MIDSVSPPLDEVNQPDNGSMLSYNSLDAEDIDASPEEVRDSWLEDVKEILDQIQLLLSNDKLLPELRRKVEGRRRDLLVAQRDVVTAIELSEEVITLCYLWIIERELGEKKTQVDELVARHNYLQGEVGRLEQCWNTRHHKPVVLVGQ